MSHSDEVPPSAGRLWAQARGLRPWKQGESGHPGRARKSNDHLLLTSKLLDQLSATSLQGRPLPAGLDVADLIVIQLVVDAVKGVPSARKEVFERVEGRVPERIELDAVPSPPPDFDDSCARVYGLPPTGTEVEQDALDD